MFELLMRHPWLLAVALGVLVPVVAIVFGTVTRHLTDVRRAELESNLKQDMVQRGMSVEEIVAVVEASAYRRGRRHSVEVPCRS